MTEKFNPNPGKPNEGESMRWTENYPKADKEEIEEARKRGRALADKLMGPEPVYGRPGFASKGKRASEISGDQEQLRKTARRLAFMAQPKEGTANFEAEIYELFGDKQEPAKMPSREEIMNLTKIPDSLDAFTGKLEKLFENDPWLRGQVGGWDLVQIKPNDAGEPRYKMSAVFENNRAKHKKEKTIFTGTYSDIMDALEEELAFHEPHLRVVGDDEVV